MTKINSTYIAITETVYKADNKSVHKGDSRAVSLYAKKRAQQKKTNGTVAFKGLCVLIVSLLCLSPASAAGLADLFDSPAIQTDANDFLQVDQAFTVVPIQKGKTLSLTLEITPGHYLYKDKFALKLPTGVSATPFKFSQPSHTIDDPNFGQVPIFDQNQVIATTTLTNSHASAINQAATLTWQGCAKAGLCYPPQKQAVALTLPANSAATQSKASSQETDSSTANQTSTSNAAKTIPSKASTPQSINQSKVSEAKPVPVAVSKTPNAASQPEAISANKPSTTTSSQATPPLDDNEKAENTDFALATTNSANDLLTVDNDVSNGSLNNTVSNNANSINGSLNSGSLNNDTALTNNASIGGASKNETNENSSINNDTAMDVTFGNVVDSDPFGLATHPALALLLLFLAGLGLAFTPCVLPMLPIVSNIIAHQHKPTAKKGLLLSGCYALGVAIAYGLLGATIALFGESLGIIGWLQNPIILIGFAIVFVLLALYMLEVFNLSLPNRLKNKVQSFSQIGDNYLGSILGSFIAGFLSALVVSPCVSAPLFGALLAVSTIGNPLLGFAALFMLGFGLSAPLMLLGLSQGNLMPKSGVWMHWVKQGFALLLFAVALLLIARVLISPIMLVLWALWFAIVATWAWHWHGRGQLFTKACALLLAMWSVCVLAGAAAGSRDAWQPLAILTNNNLSVATASTDRLGAPNSQTRIDTASRMPTEDQSTYPLEVRVTSLQQLMPIINGNHKVLVDVTADWCVECRIMDKTLFANKPTELSDWQMVKLDITETNADSEQILKQLRLFGPPALLYFVDGTLKSQQIGSVERKTFIDTLQMLNN